MPKFSQHSLRELATCDRRLQDIAWEAINVIDFRVLEGHRNEAAQNAAKARGASTLPWPLGKHNALPSRAFDFSPWPIDWDDNIKALSRFTLIAGVMLAIAKRRNIKVRFGFDWNRNLDPRDEKFLDWGHIELDEP